MFEFKKNRLRAVFQQAAKILASPSRTQIIPTGTTPMNAASDYGARLRGYVTPQISGEYTFWESGDDEVQLFLSPSENPADKSLIAFHTGLTASLEWEKYPSQKSRSIPLIAGKSYYLEAIHKVGSRANKLAIAWTSPGGSREILPNSILRAWQPNERDMDDDGIPDADEIRFALNPHDRLDAHLDSDGDGIPNLSEYQNFSDPITKNEVPGHLIDEVWYSIPGIRLTPETYQQAAKRKPDFQAYIKQTQALDEGDDFIRRIRGYLIAPTTGTYQFWGSADNDMDFYLSTSASKFQLQHLIRNNNTTTKSNFDYDPSQKSQTITLRAGEKYYFELWHKQGTGKSSVHLAWKTPHRFEGRDIISSRFLRSFVIDAEDLDDDGLKDSWELAHGLNPNEAFGLNGSSGDLDGDHLSNLEEQQNGTSAHLRDSDGDGVSDFDEVHFFGSATLANQIGPFTLVAKIAGDAYASCTGEWIKRENTARQNSRRGSVTYAITAPKEGIYALKWAISSVQQGSKNELYDFHIKLNGQHLAYKTITILPDGTATLALLSPWLKAGEAYSFELFVDNTYNWRRVSINELEILAAGGVDSNANGFPDWTEIRVKDLNGLDQSGTVHSKTSPAVIEGKASQLSLVRSNAPAIIPAPNGRFFTEVPLQQEAPTSIDFSFENQALNQNTSIHWQPTNLKWEKEITLRQGDSLRLTAFDEAENASLESYRYQFAGKTVSESAHLPTIERFDTPGTHTLSFTHTASDGSFISSSTQIHVLPQINLAAPLCIVGYPRDWRHAALPVTSMLEFDAQVSAIPTGVSNTYTLRTNTPINQPLLVRAATGQILASSEIKSASIRSSDQTGPILLETIGETQILDMPVITYGDLSNAQISCKIFIGGVTYLDGTTKKLLYQSDFNPFHEHILRFQKAQSAHSNCHEFTVIHNGVNVAKY